MDANKQSRTGGTVMNGSRARVANEMRKEITLSQKVMGWASQLVEAGGTQPLKWSEVPRDLVNLVPRALTIWIIAI